MLASNVILVLAVALVGAAVVFFGCGQLLQTRWGRRALLYFFKDADSDQKPQCSAAEATTAGRFSAWTAPLMKAAHNYQLVHKDPGSWAHNFDYAAQLLYDSVQDLGGDVTMLRRP